MLSAAVLKNQIFVNWNPATANWGDALNEYLVEKISGRTPTSTLDVYMPPWEDSYMLVGSVLGMHDVSRSHIWGSGFLRVDSRIYGVPRSIRALRGPLSAKKLAEQGIAAPEVFGDPAIVMPRLYMPEVPVRYAIGIIMHKADQPCRQLQALAQEEDVIFISINEGTEAFVDQLVSCKVIATSSLHGLVAADAYRIPRVWMPGYPVARHGTFKFMDYAAGAGLEGHPKKPYAGPRSRQQIIAAAERFEHKPTVIDDLIESCPLPRQRSLQST